MLDRLAAPDKAGADLEAQVLGALLAYPHQTAETLDEHGVTARDFAFEEHRMAFEAIMAALRDGGHPDPITIAARIGNPEMVGSSAAAYFMRLAANLTTMVSTPDHAVELRDRSKRRQLSEIADRLAENAAKPASEVSTAAITKELDTALYELENAGRRGSRFQTLGEAGEAALRLAEHAYDRGGGMSGLSTGLRDLDRMLGGLLDTNLLILAARPAMGKTALALNIAKSIATEGKAVGFFSLEMSGDQLAMRILADMVDMPSSQIARGAFNEEDYDRLKRFTRTLEGLPIIIDETGGIGIDDLSRRAKRMQQLHNIKALFVDYIQIMGGTGRKSDNRVQEITAITTGLKALAKSLGIPIVALSQLSRQVETRTDKRPMLADLRDSGSIEQDADVVMFLFREEYYLEREKPVDGATDSIEWSGKMEAAANQAQVIIAKNRHGRPGTVDLRFDAATTRFSDSSVQLEARW